MEKLSPEFISGRWSVQGIDGVSHEKIFQWIWQRKAHKAPDIADLYKHLKHGRRRRKRGNDNDFRGILTDRVGIEQRPEVVGKRTRLGDLEADFMMGKAHKSALLIITDRAMLLTRLKKWIPEKQMLARVPKSFIKTLTVDNDKGFANHASIAEHWMQMCTSHDRILLRIKGQLKTELA